MKRKLLFNLAILLTALSFAVNAFAGGASVNRRTTTDSEKSNNNSSAALNDQKKGIIRIGLAGVKTGAIGEGINALALANAIQNTLVQYLKGTKIEIVPLEAKLASAIDAEAKEKACDFILYATVSHKKGGGGFGMFKKIAPVLGSVVPMAGMVGIVAGTVASTAISTAATSNVKPKDELTLDIKLQNGSTVALTKQFKAKAKSAGEDVISPIVEQAAIALVETVGK
jgi:hypothetical protein